MVSCELGDIWDKREGRRLLFWTALLLFLISMGANSMASDEFLFLLILWLGDLCYFERVFFQKVTLILWLLWSPHDHRRRPLKSGAGSRKAPILRCDFL